MSRRAREIVRRRRRPRIVSVPAGDVKAGELLWSDASMEAWRVVAATRELVRADGNLLGVWGVADAGDYDEAIAARAPAQTVGVVLSVVDELTGRRSQRLGAFAPHAELQVVRRAARAG